ncbi:MAG: patatin-like phospholipase family protein [Anaerolineaceae bacterium]|nr:patatin-like phospholipase family protein [Anaerolineaceae bacterium]
MKRKLAFVLSGGGSRGALQVGGLRALLEAGFQPCLVTGTSIGAVNAAFLSVNGFDLDGIQKLEEAWRASTTQDFLPANLWRQIMQVFFRRSRGGSQRRIRDFAIGHGLTPDLRFKDIADVRLFIVASDLNSNSPVIFGEDPEEYVLESMMASIALPPWVFPVEKEGRYLVDGGAVSNLPVEAALQQGAEEIIALDLFNPYEVGSTERGLRPFLWKLNLTVENRQNQLEMELAEARGVPVHHISLTMEEAISFWDFRHSEKMIEHGYRVTRDAIGTWESPNTGFSQRRFPLLSRLEHLLQLKK